jgi:excinuclease UvrABC nuclease subunit
MAIVMRTRKFWVDVQEIIEAIEKPKPDSCCVYVFSDRADHVLYVGKTLNPLERFGRHTKDKDWFKEIAQFEIEWCQNEVDALNREAELIKELCPRYNKVGNKSRREPSAKTKHYWRMVKTQDIIRQVKNEFGLSNLDSYMQLPVQELLRFTQRRDELLQQRQQALSKVGNL